MDYHLFIQLFLLVGNQFPNRPGRLGVRIRVKEQAVASKPISNKTKILPPILDIPIIESKWDCGEVPF